MDWAIIKSVKHAFGCWVSRPGRLSQPGLNVGQHVLLGG